MNANLVTSRCLLTVSAFIWSDKSLVKLSSPRTINSVPDIQVHFGVCLSHTPPITAKWTLWAAPCCVREALTWGITQYRGDVQEVPPTTGGGHSPSSHLAPYSPSFLQLVCQTSCSEVFPVASVSKERGLGHMPLMSHYLTLIRLCCAFLKITFSHLPFK